MFYMIQNLKKLKLYMSLLTSLCVMMAITSVLTAYFMAQLTSLFTMSGLESSYSMIALTLFFFLLDCVVGYLYYIVCGKMQATVYAELQQKCFYHITHLSIDHPMLMNQGDLYQRVNQDSTEVMEFLSSTLPKMLMQGIQIVFVVGYMLFMDWRSTAIYFIALFISLLIQGSLSHSLQNKSKRLKEQEVKLNTRIKDSITNRMTVKTYHAYDFIEDLCQQEGRQYVRSNIMFSLHSMPMQMIGLLCGMLPILVLCLIGLIFVPKGILELGSFMAMFYLCQKILPYQLHYVDLFISAVKIRVTAKRITELLKEPIQENKDNSEQVEREEVVLQNVSYRYPNTDTWAVKDVSLRISKGKKVAFIGESGCGKSTVLRLMSGLIIPTKGSVATPNTILNDQFSHFFSGTIKDNLACFEQKKQFEIDDKMNVFLDFIHDFDLELNNRASNMSGGQKQKIALARSLYQKSPVLLLDESISALDANSARSVIEHLIQYEDTTMIMVLHQMEFLPYMDEIYVFHNGTIVAYGSYEQLLSQNMLRGIANETK